MVEESQDVWTIDFPQMVSTNHPDSQFYFERDQTCIHVLFKRKFNKIFDRKYNLSEIEIKKQLDAEVRASGYDKSIKLDDMLEGYLAQARKENPADEAIEIGEDMEEDIEDSDAEVEEHEDDIEDNEQNDEGQIDAEMDLGDIEEEMKAIHGVDEMKVPVAVDEKKEEVEDDEESEGGEEEEEEVDWEARLEKRKQMKALKKEKMANKPAKCMMVKIEKPEKLKAEGDDDVSEESDQENELIKKAIKKQFRKKKPMGAKKNHPKQFNASVRDQMAGFK
jgi:RIO kinase 2